MAYLFLIAALVGLALGPVAFRLLHSSRRPSLFLDGFVLVAIVGLVALHILPEAFESIGLWVVPLIGAGVLVPIVMERARGVSSKVSHAAVLAIAFTGLFLHSALDGVGLAAANGSASLGLAIALHRFPVGLAVWWLVCPQFGRRWAVFVLFSAGVGTLLGFGIGEAIVVGSESFVQVVQAFVAGSLLHVLMHQSVGFHNHAADERGWRFAGTLGAVAGLAVVFAIPGAHEHHSPGHALIEVGLAASPLLAVLIVAGAAVIRRASRDRFRDRALGALDHAAPWTVFALVVAAVFGAELELAVRWYHYAGGVVLSSFLAISVLHQGPRDFLLHLVPVPAHDHDEHEHHSHAHDHAHDVDSSDEPVPEPT